MIYSSITSSKAQKELVESWEWYEERQKDLGDQFAKIVLRRIGEIAEHPERYPEVYKSYRQTIVDTFPFLIIYRINKSKKIVRIVSIFHTSRNPKKKFR